jgi:hypothetical protein
MTKYIALSGLARSGKDTVADYLVKNHGYVKMSFADPMREALYRLNPDIDVDGYDMKLATAVDLLGWEQLKSASQGLRGLMQRMGTEVGREMFGEDFWVNQAFNKAKQHELVVFADCRFPNEARTVEDCGGVVWRIERPGISAANSHPSETALDSYDFDWIALNDSTLENLWKSVDMQLDK